MMDSHTKTGGDVQLHDSFCLLKDSETSRKAVFTETAKLGDPEWL